MASVLTSAVAGPPNARDEARNTRLIELRAHQTSTFLNAPRCQRRQEKAAG